MWTVAQKSVCVLWFHEDGRPTSVQKKFRKKYGRNAKSPDKKSIKIWSKRFKETGSCQQRKTTKRTPTVDRTAIIDEFKENPRQSLRRVANRFNISYSSVRRALKNS